MTLQELLKANIQKRELYDAEFRRIFGFPISRFWNNLTAFDIVGFDDYLKPPDGTSLNEYVTEKYGARACEIINALL